MNAWKPLSNGLEPAKLDRAHESAIVMAVEAAFDAHVRQQRAEFGSEDLIRRQLDPHITVLYCGHHEPETLEQIARFASDFAAEEVEFEVQAVDSFYNRSGLLTNIHYRIESQTLRKVHTALLQGYMERFGQPQTPYVGSKYTPHVSIFDRVAMPKTAISLFALPGWQGPWRAGGCHLVGEPR